jgi:hypothetical protein
MTVLAAGVVGSEVEFWNIVDETFPTLEIYNYLKGEKNGEKTGRTFQQRNGKRHRRGVEVGVRDVSQSKSHSFELLR